MPRTPKDFSDFKPPWGDDPDSIDPDQLARLIHSLRVSEDEKSAEIKTLKKSNEELEDANEVFKAASEEAGKSHDDATKKAVAEVTAKLEKERDQAQEDLAELKRETDLLKVRVEFPRIDEEDIERLKGDDVDALLEDAKKFAEKHGLVEAEPGDEDEDPQDDTTTIVRRQPRLPRTPGDPKAGEGAPTDVDKFLAERAAQSAWVS